MKGERKGVRARGARVEERGRKRRRRKLGRSRLSGDIRW